MMTALPNRHYSVHHRAIEVEDDQRTPGKRDLEKEMWTAGFRYSWRKMETAAELNGVQVVCGLCSTGSEKAKSSRSSMCSVCCAALDGVVRMGRSLKDKAPQSDHEALHAAVVQLKTKWTSLCSKAVDRFVFVSHLFASLCLLHCFSAHLCGWLADCVNS